MRPRGRGEGMSDPREGRGIGRGMTGGKWEERGCLSARPTAINQMKRQHLSFFPYHLHLVLSRTDNDLQYTQPLPLPDVEEVTTHSMQSRRKGAKRPSRVSSNTGLGIGAHDSSYTGVRGLSNQQSCCYNRTLRGSHPPHLSGTYWTILRLTVTSPMGC